MPPRMVRAGPAKYRVARSSPLARVGSGVVTEVVVARGSRSSPWSDDGVIREDSADQRRAQGDRDRARREREQRRAARRPGRRKALAVVMALVIVAVGAALVVVRTRAIEDGAAPTTTASTSPATTATLAGTTSTSEQGVDYRNLHVGDCLLWDQHDTTSYEIPVQVLPCDQPHLVEMVSDRRVPDDVTEYPDSWGPIFAAVCTADVEAYLGAPLDPEGRFVINGLKPTRTSWAAHDRQLQCGLGQAPMTADDYARTAPGDLVAASGSVIGRSQDLVHEVGTCVRRAPYAVVGCTTTHDWEVTAAIALADRPAIPQPDDGAGWAAIVGDRCRSAATAYLHHAMGADLRWGQVPIDPASWAAGRRSIECTISRGDGTAMDAPARGVTA